MQGSHQVGKSGKGQGFWNGSGGREKVGNFVMGWEVVKKYLNFLQSMFYYLIQCQLLDNDFDEMTDWIEDELRYCMKVQ